MNRLPHTLPLRTDGARSGLRRLVVPTSVGDVVVHAGPRESGEATILLHGAAGSWTTWTPLLAASALTGVTEPADVLALDLPGWGESGDAERVRSVSDLSDAVVEVARALGYDSWRMIGHSLGGFVALDVAARHPDRTRDVILVSPTGAAVVDAIRRPVRGGLALPWFAGMLFTMRALALLGGGGRAIVRRFDRWGWMPTLTAPLFAAEVHPSVVGAFADEIRPSSFARGARLAARYDPQVWAGIRCRVRSVRGVRDVFGRETDAARFAALIPDFTEVRLEDAGHFAHIERPDVVQAAWAEPVVATAAARW